MMNSINIKKQLAIFAKNVEQKAQSNLKSKNKNSSGSLSKSIKSKLNVSKNSFELTFPLEDYWEFINYGVKGVGGTKADGTKWVLKKVTNNKFSYSLPSKTKSGGRFLQSLNGWTIKRGIAPRSKDGKFQKRKGMLRAIRKSIIHTGIETTNFFTDPFEEEYKSLPDKIIKAYGLDLDNFLKLSLKE